MGLIAEIHKDLEKGALQLIVEYRDRLKFEALKLCGDNASAEDLVFRTFERVLAKADTYKEDINLFAWMKTIMENIHRDDKKRPVNRGTEAVASDELERYAGADWSTDEQTLRNSDSEAIREAIAGLDPKYNKVLLMRYYDGFSMKQIAGILQLPLGTVTRRVQIAHRLLAGKLGAILGESKKPLAVILVALVSLVSAAAVATLPAFEPLRETVSSWFGSDAAQEEDIRGGGGDAGGVVGGGGVSPAQNKNVTQENAIHETQIQEKPTMKLTQTFAAAALAATAAVVTVEADGVTLESVSARQRYPWNGLVDIDYTITYDDGATLGIDDNLEVMLVDHDGTTAVTNRAITFLQAPLPMTEGSHRITWDANADGVTSRIDKAQFVMKIRHYCETYMVIDVSGGSETNCYPVDFLNGAPPNGFTDPEYKGNKIVLRRIHPGSYIAGAASSPAEAGRDPEREKQHRVALSQPFYIGIYEVTQKQFENVMGASNNKSAYKGDYRPVETVSYDTIRGTADTSNHTYDWPWNDNVDSNSFMGKLRDKCKAKDSSGNYTEPVEGFDLPTEFQWEYACRAGTTGAFNTTNAYNNASSAEQGAQLMLLGRYTSNQTDGKGGYDVNHTNVGSYQPNQWGLYDMHGNVWEWCRDRYKADATELKQFTDPKGADSGSDRLRRGGGWDSQVNYCRSAYRFSNANPSTVGANRGFRLSRTLP